MSTTPPAIVASAPRPPLPYGLFSVVAPRSGSTDRWEGGSIQLEELGCPPAPGTGLIDAYCTDETTGLPKTFASNAAFPTAETFTVYQSESCSPIGEGIVRSERIATGRLGLFEELLVERHLAGRLAAEVLLKTSALTVASTKAELISAIGKLEDDAAVAYGTQGVIHVARDVAFAAVAYRVFEVRQGRLYTALGTPVVAGAGYSALAEAYWTPQIVAYRSDLFFADSTRGATLNRSTNDLLGVSERSWVLGFDTSCGVGIEPDPEP